MHLILWFIRFQKYELVDIQKITIRRSLSNQKYLRSCPVWRQGGIVNIFDVPRHTPNSGRDKKKIQLNGGFRNVGGGKVNEVWLYIARNICYF